MENSNRHLPINEHVRGIYTHIHMKWNTQYVDTVDSVMLKMEAWQPMF